MSGVFGKNVNVVGNRLDVRLGEENYLAAGESMSAKTVSLSRRLVFAQFLLN